MKLDILRYGLRIVPEDSYTMSPGDERDTTYIEEVLGLHKEGDTITLRRVNVMGLSSLAYLETIEKDVKITAHCEYCPGVDKPHGPYEDDESE